MGQPRIVLVDGSEASREVMSRRLSAQGYLVDATGDPVSGADLALASPPAAFVADLWMSGISGVQLCRLLHTEPATADVPVILLGSSDDPRSRFWAERAGAVAYVRKGRMGDLVRALSKAIVPGQSSDGFFMQLGGGDTDIRDRIARYLDAALFESVVASEVRSLAAAGSFERLFDLFAQFLPQVLRYRWAALVIQGKERAAIHHHPDNAAAAGAEARAVLGLASTIPMLDIADEDPCSDEAGESPFLCSIPFGGTELGKLALAPSGKSDPDTHDLVRLVARELGGPVRIALLLEEQQRLATLDPLTGLNNRRSFQQRARVEVERSTRYQLPLSLILMDVDHFKSINDQHGHATGDLVLAAVGKLLREQLRAPDLTARWGGEEFVLLLPNTDASGAMVVAERTRVAVESLCIRDDLALRVSISLGVSMLARNESLDALIERADQAMYLAKARGRNRAVNAESAAAEVPVASEV